MSGPLLESEMGLPLIKPCDTGWNSLLHYCNLLLYIAIFTCIRLLAYAMICNTYFFVGMVKLADQICTVFCPSLYQLISVPTSWFVRLLPACGISIYGPWVRGSRRSSGKHQWQLGMHHRKNFWQHDHCKRGSRQWYYDTYKHPPFRPCTWLFLDDSLLIDLVGLPGASIW